MAIDTIKATAILDGAVDTADLADGAVTSAKITDGEVTDAKIASGITSSKLTGALPAIDGSSLTGVDPADGSITTAKLDSTLDLSGKTVTYGLTSGDMPSGSVLQVVSTVKSDAFSTTNNTDDDITGLSATLTPISTSSKILILVSAQVRSTGSGSGNNFVNFGVRRSSPSATGLLDGYAIVGDNGDSSDTRGNVGFTYLDSPSTTSAVTYQCTLRAQFTQTAYINSTTDPSTITLMEIAG